MKKTFLYAAMLFVAGTMLMAGCSKDNDRVYKLAADEFQGTSKTTIDNNFSIWSDGDQINVNGEGNLTVTNTGRYWKVVLTDEFTTENGVYACYSGRDNFGGYDAANHAFTYSLPSSISYSGNQLKCPMVGVATGNVINFSNVCALLKLTYTTTPSQIVISETLENTHLAGSYTATYADGEWTISENSGNSATTLTVTTTANTVYVPIPAGDHKLRIQNTIGGMTKSKLMTQTLNFEVGKVYSLSGSSAPTALGEYSISPTQKVSFARGNLQYVDGVWKFADEQYIAFGSNQNDNQRDLLFFSTTDAQSQYGTPDRYYPRSGTGTYKGWDDLFEGYYCLNQTEWEYLLFSRPGQTYSFAYAGFQTGSNTYSYGVILFPDGFSSSDWPAAAGTRPSVLNSDMGTSGFASTWRNNKLFTSYDQWYALEALGCVFLPCTGYVSGSNNYTVADYGDPGCAYYWAPSDDTETRIKFRCQAAGEFASPDIHYGFCVRLVKDYVQE